jgi:hypothetical protein
LSSQHKFAFVREYFHWLMLGYLDQMNDCWWFSNTYNSCFTFFPTICLLFAALRSHAFKKPSLIQFVTIWFRSLWKYNQHIALCNNVSIWWRHFLWTLSIKLKLWDERIFF